MLSQASFERNVTKWNGKSILCLTKSYYMRKFMQTLLFSLALIFTSSLTTTPNETDGELYSIVETQTTESLDLMKVFHVSITESESIKQYPAITPINPTDITRISSFYGERIHPIYKRKFIHRGLDLASPKGTPVIATGDGIVLGTKRVGGYGKQITIGHKDDYTSRYAHLSKILVNKGDTISRGDTIGKVGSTGLSTGNHLHYEISHHNRHIDPLSIYPDTLQDHAYLNYLQNVNDYYSSCSDLMSNN